jgi:predicted RNA-binding protein YlxR (DUF448 family)
MKWNNESIQAILEYHCKTIGTLKQLAKEGETRTFWVIADMLERNLNILKKEFKKQKREKVDEIISRKNHM